MKAAASIVLLAALTATSAQANQRILSGGDLLGLAANPYASGEVPLGDSRYVTDAPRKGYIYLCHLMGENGGGGAGRNGPWIHGTSWNFIAKLSVQGQVNWTNAQFTSSLHGDQRALSGNGLPINHPTGLFPIQSSDPVSAYDRNPSRIAPQSFGDIFPASPIYSDTPYCMGGDVGVMLTGVALFNGFDAGMRDAPAHEAQDQCGGHPQQAGQYHYHSLSPCIKDIGEKTVLGYALDGFPITGPLVANGRYLTTANLDECHGITSEIIEDGAPKITYHYVMTQDFPYSVSCFRGKPTRTGPANRPNNQNNQGNMQQPPMQNGGPPGDIQNGMQNGVIIQRGNTPNMQNGAQGMGGPPPGMHQQIPIEAASACEGMSEGSNCGFTSPRGDRISGMCRTPPGLPHVICIPQRF